MNAKLEQFCKAFGCTPYQAEALRAKNKTQLEAMYNKAWKSGKRVNGYTSEQLRQLINGLEIPQADEATPRPWSVDGVSGNGRVLIRDENGRFSVYCLHGVFEKCEPVTKEEALKRAALIVKAANEYSTHVALEKFVKKLSFGNQWDMEDAEKLLGKLKAIRQGKAVKP